MHSTAALDRNIPLGYVYLILARSPGIVMPIAFLYWRENGLSLAQIGLIEAMFAGTALALEIPSGYFADRWGRRLALVVAGVFLTASMALYCFMHGPLMVVLGELCFAGAMAFISGADSALIYDTLLAQGRAGEYRALWGRMLGISLAVMAVATVGGGWLAQYSLRAPYFAALAVVWLTIPLGLLLREPPRTRPTEALSHWAELAAAVREALWERPALRRIILYSAVLYLAFMGQIIFYQLRLPELGVPLAWFGLIYAALNLLAAAATALTHTFEQRFGAARLLGLAPLLLAAGYAGLAAGRAPWAAVFAVPNYLVRGLYRITLTDVVNRQVGSHRRATILSVQSFACSALYALAMPLLGLLADRRGLEPVFWVLAGGCLLLALAGPLLRGLLAATEAAAEPEPHTRI
jgi:MFS family permease